MSTVPTSSPSTLAAPRLVFLDALRVLAILLVVILHAMAPVLVDTKQLGQPGWYLCMLQNPINRAGVPLFFMISCLLLLQDPAIHTPLSFYRRRLPRLLLPLAVWNGIYLLLRTRPDSFRSGFEDYFRTLLTTGSCYHMWFIYTILGIYLVAPVLGFLAQRGGRTYLMILLAAAVFPTSILPLINRVLPFQAVVYTPMAEGHCWVTSFWAFCWAQQRFPARPGWRSIWPVGQAIARTFSPTLPPPPPSPFPSPLRTSIGLAIIL